MLYGAADKGMSHDIGPLFREHASIFGKFEQMHCVTVVLAGLDLQFFFASHRLFLNQVAQRDCGAVTQLGFTVFPCSVLFEGDMLWPSEKTKTPADAIHGQLSQSVPLTEICSGGGCRFLGQCGIGSAAGTRTARPSRASNIWRRIDWKKDKPLDVSPTAKPSDCWKTERPDYVRSTGKRKQTGAKTELVQRPMLQREEVKAA